MESIAHTAQASVPTWSMPARVPATGLPDASHLHHAGSFAMMLGRQLDIGVLGAHQGAAGAIPAVGG
ncbi:MAG: hypothetical protein KQH57_19240 [Actinomycetales bacterium]|nr:hypothetical protein [Actinomycetales bacterium]